MERRVLPGKASLVAGPVLEHVFGQGAQSPLGSGPPERTVASAFFPAPAQVTWAVRAVPLGASNGALCSS